MIPTLDFDTLSYFAGGVPPYAILAGHLDACGDLLLQKIESRESGESELLELVYIGLVAYAEAFFKDHFASLVNIFPASISALKHNGHDVTADLTEIIDLEEPIHSRCGFLLAEKLNFGSPKSINSLYQHLLLVTPFSKENAKEFDKVLATRNLLVHHGGIYTSRFLQGRPALGARKFVDSLRMERSMAYDAAALINDVAVSTVLATAEKLKTKLEQENASPHQFKGVELLQFETHGGSERTSQLVAGFSRWLEIEKRIADKALTDLDVPF